MKREKRGPEYVARGTAIGIFFGLTPMVWQMNLVLLTWIITRYFKWNFSLPIGLAWTWVSNTVTNIPLLYLYYATGQIMTGHTDIGGYKTFMGFFNNGIWEGIKIAAKDWGASILLGSLVYMTAGGALGYFLSYRYARRKQKVREQKASMRDIEDKAA